ncbi:MAG: ABC transporter ATP-binding protein [Planctomycetota bacterium]
MLEVRDAVKTYRRGGETIRAVDGVSLRAEPGDLLVLHGPSGSGKSTLLLMAGGMLPPDSGHVCYNGEDVYAWSSLRRNAYRKRTVGFVFQRFFLMPYLSVYDNIRVPLALRGERDTGARVRELAGRLRIEHRLGHRPGELSIGEQQRAAIARALAGDKTLLLADEPSGNLDEANIEILAQTFRDESRRGRIILLATHNPTLVELGTRDLRLEAGRLAGA